MSDERLATIFAQLSRFLGMFRKVAESHYQFDSLLENLGWSPEMLAELPLADVATMDLDWSENRLVADDWKAQLVLGELKIPFLQSAAGSQFIQLKEISPPEFDLENAKIRFDLCFSLQIVGTLRLKTEAEVTFSLNTLPLEDFSTEGLSFISEEKMLEGDFLGLHWRFKGVALPIKEGEKQKYKYFKLLIKNYDYRIKQVPGCKLELEYSQISREPIAFEVQNFELSEKGVMLKATVTDRPVTLNGINTKFRFQDSSFEIVENVIQSFTLMGSGPIPSVLLGEGIADIAMEFEQRDGSLRLVIGSAELKGTKELSSKETRFQYTIDALGFRFVDDGNYHLYFTITGSARFVLGPGDDENGALSLLSLVQIELVDCPIAGDSSVVGKHVDFLIPLPKPIEFSFLGCFNMEVRGFGFYPQAKAFDDDPALLIAGQVKFAEGFGDAATSEIDHHRLFIGLPEKGKFEPRLYMSDLPVNINMGEAFRLNGTVKFYDDKTISGFAGEGNLQIQGLPMMAASFSFVRARRDELSQWLRAWFIYLEVRQLSYPIPTVQLYLREVGLGFGYRYTLAGIKEADEANDIGELIGKLRDLSRSQGNLATIGDWSLDLEEAGQDPRWTVVLRALIAQASAALPPLE